MKTLALTKVTKTGQDAILSHTFYKIPLNSQFEHKKRIHNEPNMRSIMCEEIRSIKT